MRDHSDTQHDIISPQAYHMTSGDKSFTTLTGIKELDN